MSAEKRQRAGAVQDAGALPTALVSREASWTAPALWRFGILVLTLTFAGNLFGADIAADFSAANKLYAEGKFADAANAYEKILPPGATSPALLFNAGNAEFKSGHLGRAIAAYKQAAQLAPRDSEIRANLAFVRNQVSDATRHENHLQNALAVLTPNEWAWLAAAAFWMTFILLATRQLRPALIAKLKTATWISAAPTFFSCAMLALQAANHFHSFVAVVTSAEAIARSGPFAEAQSVFTVRDGVELQVLGRHDDWIQAANGAGKIGWLPVKQVEILRGA